MKKFKIMLLSFAILAVVGGALAFKASTKFTFDYCVTNTVPTPLGFTCPDEIDACLEAPAVKSTNFDQLGVFTCTTLKPQGVDCADITTCNIRTKTTID